MSRKPDFYLKAINDNLNTMATVGAAWSNPNGSISIVLDPFTIIGGHGISVHRNTYILYPLEKKATKKDSGRT